MKLDLEENRIQVIDQQQIENTNFDMAKPQLKRDCEHLQCASLDIKFLHRIERLQLPFLFGP